MKNRLSCAPLDNLSTGLVRRDLCFGHCASPRDTNKPACANLDQSQSTNSRAHGDSAAGKQTAETLPRLRAGLCANPRHQRLRQDRRLGAGARRQQRALSAPKPSVARPGGRSAVLLAVPSTRMLPPPGFVHHCLVQQMHCVQSSWATVSGGPASRCVALPRWVEDSSFAAGLGRNDASRYWALVARSRRWDWCEKPLRSAHAQYGTVRESLKAQLKIFPQHNRGGGLVLGTSCAVA